MSDTAGLQAIAVRGIPEITPGADLGAIIARACAEAVWPDGSRGLRDDDVVVVTSKVVSKAEGRMRPAAERDAAIDEETIDVVARRDGPGGSLAIVRDRRGLVLAAAGVDESNAPDGFVLLLPEDPDASARALREALEGDSGRRLGVIVTDTLGRAWRLGLTDCAIGIAGLDALDDLRGQPDASGRSMSATVVAVADEIAAAADLVKGKVGNLPVAVVRGHGHPVTAAHGPGAQTLQRPPSEDLFPLGTQEARAAGSRAAVGMRRTIRSFGDDPVDPGAVHRAIAAAATAPAPHHARPWRFAVLDRGAARERLLAAMAEQWRDDLRTIDGLDGAAIDRRVARGDLLHRAPVVVMAFLDTRAAHHYPDERRSSAERDMFVAAGGAAIEALMVSLAAEGWGSAWVSSSFFCADTARSALGIVEPWLALGAIAVGRPAKAPIPRPAPDLAAIAAELEYPVPPPHGQDA